MAAEPCVVCGEDTSLGHPEYLGRRAATGRDGHPRYLCVDCEALSRPPRRRALSEEERRRIEEHASMFGIAFNATGH